MNNLSRIRFSQLFLFLSLGLAPTAVDALIFESEISLTIDPENTEMTHGLGASFFGSQTARSTGTGTKKDSID